jgi:tetratricopeptide (TPR) repeat protein
MRMLANVHSGRCALHDEGPIAVLDRWRGEMLEQTAVKPEADGLPVNVAVRASRADRRWKLFLQVGSFVLVLAVVAIGVLYYLDQRGPSAPTLVDQRVAVAEDAVRQNPNDIPVRIALAELYNAQGRVDDAVKQYGEVIKVAPGDPDARLGRGVVLLGTNDLAGASADFQAIVDAGATGEFAGADVRLEEAYYYLGVIAVLQRRPDAAIDELTKALKITATDSDALYQRGLALAAQGKHQDAIADWNKALTFVPTGWCEPYAQLATSYTALAQPEEAAYANAMGAYCDGAHEDAKQRLTDLSQGPAAIDAMLGLGLIAQVDNDKSTAIGWYTKVLTKDPANATAIGQLAALGVKPGSTSTAGGDLS